MINLGLHTDILQLHVPIKDNDSQLYPKSKKISTHQDSSTDNSVPQQKVPSYDKHSLSQTESMLN